MADGQMRALIFCMAAFSYIDGNFDQAERDFIRARIGQIQRSRVETMPVSEAQTKEEVIEEWTHYFEAVLDEFNAEIQSDLTESVAEGENIETYVSAKLKLRCFEQFQGLELAHRVELLDVVEELMSADGVVHPAEKKLAGELRELLNAPVLLFDDDIELSPPTGIIIEQVTQPEAQPDHEMLSKLEHHFAQTKEGFAKDAEQEIALISGVLDKLSSARHRGAGKLRGAKTVKDFEGEHPFLDRFVHVVPTRHDRDYELLVLGDLHGCYSCLKAALLQADFFGKVQAYHDDPKHHPIPKLILLGDYIDRGKFSLTGVVRTILKIYSRVPEHVIMLRGNHEHFVDVGGKIMSPVSPAEAINSLYELAPESLFRAYMELFDNLPNALLFDRMLFVHAGIPRDSAIANHYKDLDSLNHPEIRFQMLWSDPSAADFIPAELQETTARFPFGRLQFRKFMSMIGCHTLIRGHERIVEGYRVIYPEPEAMLISLFSSGGSKNRDLPEKSSYRKVAPMALNIRYKNGVAQLMPFMLDYQRFNSPEHNRFFEEQISG